MAAREPGRLAILERAESAGRRQAQVACEGKRFPPRHSHAPTSPFPALYLVIPAKQTVQKPYGHPANKALPRHSHAPTSPFPRPHPVIPAKQTV